MRAFASKPCICKKGIEEAHLLAPPPTRGGAMTSLMQGVFQLNAKAKPRSGVAKVGGIVKLGPSQIKPSPGPGASRKAKVSLRYLRLGKTPVMTSLLGH